MNYLQKNLLISAPQLALEAGGGESHVPWPRISIFLLVSAGAGRAPAMPKCAGALLGVCGGARRLVPPTQDDSSHFPASLTRGRGGAGTASGCWRVRAFHHLVVSSGARRLGASCQAPRAAVASVPRGTSRSTGREGLPPLCVGKLQPRAGGPRP